MSAQPTPPDDFHAMLEHMYTDITRYTDKRIEVQNRQILSDHSELAARMSAVEERLTNVEERLTALERSNTEILAFLLVLRDSFSGFATDIIKQMRDGFAAQAEALNELAVRVERLERRGRPKDE